MASIADYLTALDDRFPDHYTVPAMEPEEGRALAEGVKRQLVRWMFERGMREDAPSPETMAENAERAVCLIAASRRAGLDPSEEPSVLLLALRQTFEGLDPLAALGQDHAYFPVDRTAKHVTGAQLAAAAREIADEKTVGRIEQAELVATFTNPAIVVDDTLPAKLAGLREGALAV